MSMLTFVLLQCILQTSALRSQASPSRHGTLTAARRHTSKETDAGSHACDIETLRIDIAQLSSQKHVLNGDSDQVDKLIGAQLTRIDDTISMRSSSPSEDGCPGVQVTDTQLHIFGMKIEITAVFAHKAQAVIKSNSEVMTDAQFVNAMNAVIDEFNDEELDGALEVMDQIEGHQSHCDGSGTGTDHTKELEQCAQAKEYLVSLREKKNAEKQILKNGREVYETHGQAMVLADMHRKVMDTESTALDTQLKSIIKVIEGKTGAAKDLETQMNNIQEKLVGVEKELAAIRTKFDIISSLLITAKDLSTAVENIRVKTQGIISKALIYHHKSMVNLIKWYADRPIKEQKIDLSVLQTCFSSLEQSCSEYKELGVAVQEGDLMVSGTPVLTGLPEDLVGVISTNDICKSIQKPSSLEKYSKHFHMQMHREWKRNLKQIEHASNTLKRPSFNTDQTDMGPLIDMYLDAFKPSNTFFNSYLKFWRDGKYFKAIHGLVERMHDDVRSVNKEMQTRQSDAESWHQTLKKQFEDLQQKFTNLQTDIKKQNENLELTEDEKKDLEQKIILCDEYLRNLKKMADEQNKINVEQEANIMAMLERQVSLLTLRMTRFSLG